MSEPELCYAGNVEWDLERDGPFDWREALWRAQFAQPASAEWKRVAEWWAAYQKMSAHVDPYGRIIEKLRSKHHE